ncbi:MAG TPA: metalloregulator ArsR/SmtB family transcription factor [Cellulomonas sp.]
MPAADPLSLVLHALADPVRRDIVARLTSGDATVGELAAPYDITTQAISKHLRVLEQAGLVSRRREAQRRPVHLEVEVLDLMTMWIERHRREAELHRRRESEALLPAQDTGAQPSPVQPSPAPAGPTAGSGRVFEPWDLSGRSCPARPAEPAPPVARRPRGGAAG